MQSLVGIANNDELRPAGPIGRCSTGPPHASGGRAGCNAATVLSPPPFWPPRALVRRDDARDDISIVSSDPRTNRDQRQVLRERVHEDAQTTIKRWRDARHQSDRRAGPTTVHPTPGGYGGPPYDVGCPAFHRELRQFQWPTNCMFKPDVGEKYNGKTHPWASTPSRCKLLGPATTRCLPITLRWHPSPMLCHG